MLVCEGCNLGCHIDCLKPPLQEVPSGDFICDDCPSSSSTKATLPQKQSYDAAAQNNVGITQDEFTLQYLKTGDFPPYSTEAEKARMRARSQCYGIPIQGRPPGAQAN
ncbi:TPA: Tyrosine-protein kinase baz1b [Trebouxia sp. C0004]